MLLPDAATFRTQVSFLNHQCSANPVDLKLLCVVYSDSGLTKRKQSHKQGLTETTVSIMYQEISSQGSGCEVVHTAGAVGHISHHNCVCFSEP